MNAQASKSGDKTVAGTALHALRWTL